MSEEGISKSTPRLTSWTPEDNQGSSQNHNLVPWLPEKNFWEANHAPISNVFENLAEQNPKAGVPDISNETEKPSEETMKWMWLKLLGRQHGTMEGPDSKVHVPREKEYIYWPNMNRIHYGDHYFTVPSEVEPGKEYTKGFVIGGIQDENVDRLLAMLGYNPEAGNVRQMVMIAGQRPRGKWQAPGEASTDELLYVTSKYSGADMERLRKLSPFVKAQLAKPDIGLWDRPFASEYEMCRLAVEAVFMNQIDWKNYPVHITIDEHSEAKNYETAYGVRTIPARREAVATYTLSDGRLVYVLNGEAIDRGNNEPRPTSDSITREAVEHLDFGKNEKLVFASSIPHTRAAIDALVRVASLRRLAIDAADVVTGQWLPWKELLAGMGELPAMYKVDQRLRAVVAGKDPDAPELASL